MKKPVSSSPLSISWKKFLRPATLLGGVIFVLVLMLGAQVIDAVQQVAMGRTPPAITPVMAETPPEKQSEKPTEKPAKAGVPAVHPPEMPTPAVKAEDAPAEEAASPDTIDEQDSYSDAEVKILRRLSDRRKELDSKATELEQREALLKVTESRVDKKITQLNNLKEEIQKIVGVATDGQKAQAKSMIKIYETMKPKDAAAIFEKMDLQVLMGVVRHMKENKVAAIMGAMDPNKAKELTAALLEVKKIPAIPQ